MKKNIVVVLGTVFMISAMALSACGGSKQAETSAETQSTEATTQQATTETTAELGYSELNYDIANALDSDYDTLVKTEGTPSADSGDSGDIRTMTVGSREYKLYNIENDYHGATCFRVVATAGEIYDLAADKMTVEDFEKTVEIDGDATLTDAITDGDYAIGASGDKVLTYTAGEGYDIQIVLDADGGISKDSKAAMSVIADEEEMSADTEEEETSELTVN